MEWVLVILVLALYSAIVWLFFAGASRLEEMAEEHKQDLDRILDK